MVDIQVLRSKGLDNKRLKEIFTSKDKDGFTPMQAGSSPRRRFARGDLASANNQFSQLLNLSDNPSDFELRQFFEERIMMRLDEAWDRSFESYRLYSAVDIAMDAAPINQFNWPLMLLAQGHIDLQQCYTQVNQLSSQVAGEIFEFNKDSPGKPFKVNFPKFAEVSYSLVHSLVTRRVAAVSTPISTRFPFVKYDSRSTSMVGKLKAELMTQRAEIMADQFGYRHDIVQSVRDASCYSHQVEFCRSSWDRSYQTLKVKKPVDGATGAGADGTDIETKRVLVKEGIDFTAPHPTRVFYDIEYPLAKLNSDTGPTYVGYWDVKRFGDIRSSDAYFNRDAVEMDPAAWELFTNNRSYFQQYADTIVFPSSDRLGNIQSMGNDRKSMIGYYADSDDDVSVTVTEYFEKVNPSKIGLADYDGDVWLRLVVGGDRTIIFAEVMPSSPAVVYSYNENDSRLYSPSFAHAVMPYQDQVSNLLTQLLEVQIQGLTKIFELNKDGMDEASIQEFEDSIKGKRYESAKNILVKFSAQKALDVGIDKRSEQRIKVVEISTVEKTTEIFKSIVQLLAFAERLLFFSPQELGQVAPREITATEANIVNNTTLGIRDFHTLGIEEGLAAKKRIICEATVAMGSDEIQLPVVSRFPRSVVQRLGAKIVETDGDPDTIETEKNGRFTLQLGSADLLHDYAFTSRDGLDRPQSTAVAAAQIQLLQVISQSPQIQGVISNEKMMELINEIARNLGGGMDLKLELPEGTSPTSAMTPDVLEQVKSAMGSVTQAIQTLAAEQQKDRKAIQTLSSAVVEVSKAVANTKRGEVAPGIPNGAPPLMGAQAPAEPPAFIPQG